MADGAGCTCGAYGECECGCGADWTPQKLIDARAEISRLKEANSQWISDSAEADTAVRREARKVLAPIDVDGDSYAVPSLEDITASLVAEIARLRLTDEEREALAWAVSAAENVMHPADSTLRKLLERLT